MANPYEVLGVNRDAGMDDIKRAYKRLVRECHPDLNQGPSAEARFKAVRDAYTLLSDHQQRALYDEFGEMSLQPGFDPRVARGYNPRSDYHKSVEAEHSGYHDMAGFSDIFGAIFGGGQSEAQGTPSDGGDEHITARIEPMMSFVGGLASVSVRRANGHVETLRIRVQAGVRTGDVVRLTGQGHPGRAGGLPGDLVVELDIPDHPVFRRRGDDLEMDVPVTLMEAVEGGVITVPTPTGPKQVNLPPRCGGRRLRLRGRGIQRNGTPGHLILQMRVTLPDNLDADTLTAVRRVESAYDRDVRSELKA